MKEAVVQAIEASLQTITRARHDEAFIQNAIIIAQSMVESLKNGGKIFFCGNGGSAADSQHLAAELVARLNYDRPGLAAIALTTDSSALTAIGNDYGYDYVFARQVEALVNKGDIVVGISTSGNSGNVLRALEAAVKKGAVTVGFSGESGGGMATFCDYMLKAPSRVTPNIQECHIMMGHIICGLVEDALFAKAYKGKTF